MPNFVTPGVGKRPVGRSDTPNQPLLRQLPDATRYRTLRCADRVGYSVDRESIMSCKQFKNRQLHPDRDGRDRQTQIP
jgi:hypothetical protein